MPGPKVVASFSRRDGRFSVNQLRLINILLHGGNNGTDEPLIAADDLDVLNFSVHANGYGEIDRTGLAR